jgi:hypothetical protein
MGEMAALFFVHSHFIVRTYNFIVDLSPLFLRLSMFLLRKPDARFRFPEFPFGVFNSMPHFFALLKRFSLLCVKLIDFMEDDCGLLDQATAVGSKLFNLLYDFVICKVCLLFPDSHLSYNITFRISFSQTPINLTLALLLSHTTLVQCFFQSFHYYLIAHPITS